MGRRDKGLAGESATFLCVVMTLFGIVLILLGEVWLKQGIARQLVQSFGVVVTSVFVVSLLYEKFLAEKHLAEYKRLFDRLLTNLNTIQSKCMKLGIDAAFETRRECEERYPLSALIDMAKEGSEFYCVARSMHFFLNKTQAVQEGLNKGLQFKLACTDDSKETWNKVVAGLTFLQIHDINSALDALRNIVHWAVKNDSEGSIEVRFHKLHLPDTALLIETDDGVLVIWDLSFGRDVDHKKVLVLKEGPGGLGDDLADRYLGIWEHSEKRFEMKRGEIVLDKLGFAAEDEGTGTVHDMN